MKSKKAFCSFVSNASANPEVGGQPLESFLIRPIQRIPRYNMMLHDLAANTWPSHPDYDPIHAAANVMQETAAFVDESVHRKERLDKVFEIQEKLIPAEYQLVKPSRIFVFQAEMLSVGKTAYNQLLFYICISDYCLVTKQTTFSKHLKIRSEFRLVPLKVSVVGPKSRNGDNQNTILSFTSHDVRQQLELYQLSSAPDPQPSSDDMKDAERYSVGDYEGRYLVEIVTQNDWWMLDLEEEDRRKDFIVRLIALVGRRVWELLQTKSPESEYVLNSAQVVGPRAESASPSRQVKSTTGRITHTGSEARPANVVVQPGTAASSFSLSSALKSAMEDIGSDPPPALATPPNQSWRASLNPNSQPAGQLSRTPPPPRLQQNQPGMIAGGSQNPTLPQNKPLKMVPRTSNPVSPSSTLQNTRTSGKPVTLSSDLSHSPSVMKASMKLKQPAGSQLKHITPNVSIRNQTTELKNEEMLEGVSKESLSRVQAAVLKCSL
ncbi:putative RhoGEF domain containing protein [Blattamonas nauphoetae]|uniref:RhoGEF domain containing protein n=1 Tax=Blattamonas nauphoetae TaxID=2049346 RepID=A0ABQ9Y8M9_9EUKA|nr:putative RhoGEF domain containing protein [Blattamonas nauphoetae]